MSPAAAPTRLEPGKKAPAFTLLDQEGEKVKLSDFKGKYVVLEWNNPNCPFVMKHYDSGNMQSLQKRFGADNVAWISVNSTSDSHSDYMSPEKLAAWFKQQNAAPAAVLMDTKGLMPGAVRDLGAATESVGDDDGPRVGIADRGQQHPRRRRTPHALLPGPRRSGRPRTSRVSEQRPRPNRVGR